MTVSLFQLLPVLPVERDGLLHSNAKKVVEYPTLLEHEYPTLLVGYAALRSRGHVLDVLEQRTLGRRGGRRNPVLSPLLQLGLKKEGENKPCLVQS